MHAARSQVVVVVVGQKNTADQNSDDPAHIQSLCDDVRKNAEEIGHADLVDLAVNQKPEIFEQKRADYGATGSDAQRGKNSEQQLAYNFDSDVPCGHVRASG